MDARGRDLVGAAVRLERLARANVEVHRAVVSERDGLCDEATHAAQRAVRRVHAAELERRACLLAEEARLIDGLVRARVHRLEGAIRREREQRDARVPCLDDRGQVVRGR